MFIINFCSTAVYEKSCEDFCGDLYIYVEEWVPFKCRRNVEGEIDDPYSASHSWQLSDITTLLLFLIF